MYSYLYRTYASNNPAGIEINLGVYALCEAILAKKDPTKMLKKWCGIEEPPKDGRKDDRPAPKTESVIRLYEKNKKLKNREIAKIVGCTPEMVCKALRSIGVRRNRWDGYISKNKRYSKNKRKGKVK